MSMSYCVKLDKVLHAFLEGSFPKDDTMVEKLITWLESWLMSPGALQAFLEKTSLTTMVQSVRSNKSADVQMLSFYLRLTSYIPREETGVHNNIQELYKLVMVDHMTHPVVSNAWLLGLTTMLKYDTSLKQWIIEQGLHVRILSCLLHRSMFVQKAAKELTASLVATAITDTDTDDRTRDSNIQLRQSVCELWTSCQDNGDLMLSILEILSRAVVKCGDDSHRLCEEYGVFDKVYSILGMCGDYDHALRKQSMHILTQIISTLSQENVLRLENLVLTHLQASATQTAMVLAYWLIIYCSDQVFGSDWLIQTQFLAIHLVSQSDQALLTAHGELGNRIRDQILQQGFFPDLFTRQLELMENYQSRQTMPSCHSEQLVGVLQQLYMTEASDNPLVCHLYKKRHKLCLSIIQALTAVYTNVSDSGYGPQMCNFVLSCADNLTHSQSAVTVQKSLAAIIICLKYLHGDAADYGTDGNQGETLSHVCGTVRTVLDQLLCHTSWEIIDSTVEFITQLLHKLPDHSSDILHERTVSNIIQLASHGESYLRASAITCLAAMATVPSTWETATTIHDEVPAKDVILDKIVSASTDEEAFPRRAAVLAICSLYELYTSRSPSIFKVISKATSDLDWEVKKAGLDFWSLYIKRIQKGGEILKDEVEELYSSGCLQSVLLAAHDCDKTVQTKACGILNSLQQRYMAEPPVKKPKIESRTTGDSSRNGSRDLMDELCDLDVSGLLEVCQQSTYQYDVNPETLLDDILISVRGPDTEIDQDIEDNAIDCY